MQLRPHELDLLYVRCTLGDHALDTTLCSLDEHVGRRLETEWHHVGPEFRHLFLSLCICAFAESERAKLVASVVCKMPDVMGVVDKTAVTES